MLGGVDGGAPGAGGVRRPGGQPVPGQLGDALLGHDEPRVGDSSSRAWATRACRRASREGRRGAATASRVSAWVNATRPASGSCTSPASRAGAAGRRPRRRRAPATGRGRRGSTDGRAPRRGGAADRVCSGSASIRRSDHVPHGRRAARRRSRAPSRASSTRKNGLPSGRACHSRDDVGGHRCPAHLRDQRGGLGQVQSRRVEADHVAARQLLADLGQGPRGSGHGLLVTTTASGCSPAVTQMAEHAQAGGVGPVQVLEHDQQRTLSVALSTSVRDALPGPERLRSVSTRRAARRRVAGPASSGLDRGRLVARRGCERLAPRPQRRGPVVLRTPSRRHHEALRSRLGPGPLDQARLADARPRRRAGRTTRCRLRRGRAPRAARPPPRSRPTVVPAGAGSRRERPAGGCATDGRRSRLCRGTQPLLQHRVLLEHRLLEVAQLLAGIEAELLGEHRADLAQRRQRVGLATGARQRERVQRPEPLLERVPAGGLLGRRHDDRVVAEREQPEDAVLLGSPAQLVERGPLERRPRGGRAGRRRRRRSTGPSSSSSRSTWSEMARAVWPVRRGAGR